MSAPEALRTLVARRSMRSRESVVWVPSLLSLRERSVARLAGVVEGDFRDWEAVDQWADEIVEALKA